MASLVLQVQQTARLFDRMLDPMLEEIGVLSADVPVLVVAAGRRGVTLSELKEAFGYRPSTLSVILRRLEEIGYVRRSREAPDGRVVIVRATGVGATAGRVALARIQLIEHRIALRAGEGGVAGAFAVLDASRSIRRPTRYD